MSEEDGLSALKKPRVHYGTLEEHLKKTGVSDASGIVLEAGNINMSGGKSLLHFILKLCRNHLI